MKQLLVIISILSAFSILVSSCVPSQNTIRPTATQTLTTPATATSALRETPANTPSPEPTIAPTATPDVRSAIRVPEDQPTIQAGIDAAPDGGIVLVSPGTYTENITLANKSVILASHFYISGDEQLVDRTIIDGNKETAIIVARTAGPDTKIIGFTIQNGDNGISARTTVDILNNRILHNKDGVDYQDGGGLNSGNLYEKNTDDGVDLDGSTDAIVENNIIRDNKDDGIEVRLHEYRGPTLNIVIRNNIISGNLEDGIQIIDYPDLSDRVIHIEHNLIQKSAMAGLGLMDNGETKQDFRAASIPERIYLINNTFMENPYAVSGGDNLIALNNIFLNSTTLALKNVDTNSIIAHNLFWNNKTDSQGSNMDGRTSLFLDPMLDAEAQLQQGSPAIDAGIAHFEWNGEIVLDLPQNASSGSAPDLGAFESDFAQVFHNPWYGRRLLEQD